MDYKEIAATVGPRDRAGTQDWVYRVQREGIVSGALRGGMQLKQDEISSSLNVSHIPVREALRQLEAQNLVTIHPNRGASVTELSRETLIDMMQVRAAIAVAMVEISVPRMTEDDFKELDYLINEQKKCTDALSYEKLNLKFHQLISQRASNPVAVTVSNIIHSNIDRYLREAFYNDPIDRAASIIEHKALVDACRTGDPQTVGKLLRDHIMNAVSRIPKDLK